MKFDPKTIFRSIFYQAGYYPPEKVVSPNKFADSLLNQPPSVVDYRLKVIGRRIRQFDNHEYYNKFLKQLIPEWEMPLQEQQFIGDGRGAYNPNIYRKVKIDGKWYFEKIYYTHTSELQANRCFFREIYPNYDFFFKVPSLVNHFEGKLLTIAYFDYFNLKKLPPQEMEEAFIAVSRELYAVSKKVNLKSLMLRLPKNLKTIEKDYEEENYTAQRKEARAKLLRNGVAVNKIDELVHSSQRVLGHRELHQKNVYQNHIVIDWDEFGIYPIGINIPVIYIRLCREGLIEEELGDWIERRYKTHISQKDWEDFKRNVFYFTFLRNHSKYFTRAPFREIGKNIMEVLKTY